MHLNHSSPLALFPSFLPFTPSHHPHLFHVTPAAVSYRNGSTENRPMTLRSQIASNARVSCTLSSSAAHSRGHTEFMSPTARATLTPGTLIINSNLNLTSNADPRDNIVVTISPKNPVQMLKFPCFLFAFHAPEFSVTCFLDNRPPVPSVELCQFSFGSIAVFSAAFNETHQAVKGIVNPLTKDQVYIYIAAEMVRIY